MTRFLVFFFIFVGLFNLGFSYPQGRISQKEVPAALFLRREGSFYFCKGEWDNLIFLGKKLSLDFQGTVKKDKDLFIFNLDPLRVCLNHCKAKNFSSYILYKKGALTLSYFRGEGFTISGNIDFSPQPVLKLDIDIKGMSLRKLNKFLGIEDFPFQGDFRGKITLQGKLDNLLIEGELEAFGANLEDYKIERVFLNFRGSFPWIYFSDSYALLENIHLDLEGACNLAKLYNLPYAKSSNSEYKKDFLKSKENASLRGFLDSQAPGVFVYRLGSESFLKFTLKKRPLPAPEIKF